MERHIKEAEIVIVTETEGKKNPLSTILLENQFRRVEAKELKK